jgi:hypothetical protein
MHDAQREKSLEGHDRGNPDRRRPRPRHGESRGRLIESVITKRSAEEMSLKKGDTVTAVVKATEVMIAKP